jgi:hypothetical protein
LPSACVCFASLTGSARGRRRSQTARSPLQVGGSNRNRPRANHCGLVYNGPRPSEDRVPTQVESSTSPDNRTTSGTALAEQTTLRDTASGYFPSRRGGAAIKWIITSLPRLSCCAGVRTGCTPNAMPRQARRDAAPPVVRRRHGRLSKVLRGKTGHGARHGRLVAPPGDW